MPQLNIGLQCWNILAGGVDAYTQPAASDLVITGFCLNVSMIPVKSDGTVQEILFNLSVSLTTPPAVDPIPAAYSPSPIPNNDWNASVSVNPNNFGVANVIGGSGYVCAGIMKTISEESSRLYERTGLAYTVPAAGCLVLHFDHSGSVACDVEIQGVVDYMTAAAYQASSTAQATAIAAAQTAAQAADKAATQIESAVIACPSPQAAATPPWFSQPS